MIFRPFQKLRWLLSALMVASLAGCGSLSTRDLPASPPTTAKPAPSPSYTGDVWQRPKALWIATDFDALPGWEDDNVAEWWPAIWRGCVKPTVAWASVCADVRKLGMNWGEKVESGFVRQWIQSRLQPWHVQALDGRQNGMLTGYFEPMLDGRRQADDTHRYPLHRTPQGLGQRKPFLSRYELERTPEGIAALAGRELVYLSNPLDVLMIQIQGSGRVRLLDELDAQGQAKVVRLAFGGHNDQPYVSVARWLVEQGAFPIEQASWASIRQWAANNPERVDEMMHANPRVIFFQEEPLPDPEVGPNGALGVPLTPGRSIAVDRESIPLGTPVWMDSSAPPPAHTLKRLVMAQDIGSAILGAVRADYFWGWGDEAFNHAARTKQTLSLWVLWPQGAPPPPQTQKRAP